MVKIWHTSDTHTKHRELKVPPKVDLVIHSGDFSDSANVAINYNQSVDFLDWFSKLECEKVLVGGNHDLALESGMITKKQLADLGIHYLENSFVELNGLKIYGSPVTPSFGRGWAWNVARHKTHYVWDQIPNDIDILVTHGPPLSILDLTLNKEYDQAGCRSLRTKVLDLANRSLKLHCFGHIHNSTDVYNAGVFRFNNAMFSNASAVEDKTMNLIHHGNLFII